MFLATHNGMGITMLLNANEAIGNDCVSYHFASIVLFIIYVEGHFK